MLVLLFPRCKLQWDNNSNSKLFNDSYEYKDKHELREREIL